MTDKQGAPRQDRDSEPGTHAGPTPWLTRGSVTMFAAICAPYALLAWAGLGGALR